MIPDQPAPQIDRRIEHLARGADLTAVAGVLQAQRLPILNRWLEQAARQPFHAEHPDRAVADHIPALLDAITALIAASAPRDEDVPPPLEDEAVASAAKAHAQVRFEQGLGPVAIATEFRLLRQEISRALREHLHDELPATDIVSSVMVVNDALDGATMLALDALTTRIETVREEFLATTLHDVRQPITLVEGSLVLAARWLRRPPVDLERLLETIDGALLATFEMMQVIDTLADASRIAMGALELDVEPCDVRAVADEAVQLLEPESRRRIHIAGGPSGPILGEWDPRAIRRVITNLLTNAAKYSPPGTPIEMVLEATAGEVRVRVRDEGIGLLPAEIAMLFQRYGRVETAKARRMPGLGLGLYASRGLVEAHGGQIWLESAGRDQGTTAHVVLPRQPALDGDRPPDWLD